MVNSFLAFQPLLTMLIAIFAKIQDFELSSILIMFCFFIPGNLMILIGMQQFEDRYQGGEIGFSVAARDRLKIKHMEELQMMELSELSNSLENNTN